MPPRDVARCTMTQLAAMLERPSSDPHAGQEPINGPADLERMWEEFEEEMGDEG